MATRSAIAVKKPNGTVQAVYCHWDGYPQHNGKILGDHYDYNKTLQLVTLGNISILAPEIHPSTDAHSFDSPEEGVCVFYHRDRGETGQDPKTFNTVGDFADHYEQAWCEYFYFIDTDGEWYVSKASDRKSFELLEYKLLEKETA